MIKMAFMINTYFVWAFGYAIFSEKYSNMKNNKYLERILNLQHMLIFAHDFL
jgi:hypothetical protein